MSILVRAVAAYLVLIGAVIAVNFVLTPVYHPGGDEPFTVWETLNWFMAAAMVLTLVFSYQYKRRIDKDESADVKRFIEANTVFHVTIVVFLLFFFKLVQQPIPQQRARRASVDDRRHSDAHRPGRHWHPDVAQRGLIVGHRARLRFAHREMRGRGLDRRILRRRMTATREAAHLSAVKSLGVSPRCGAWCR